MNMSDKPQPPQWATRFFRWFCHGDIVDDILGDLNELFDERISTHTPFFARRKFVLDVLLLFRPEIIKHFQFPHYSFNQFYMLKHYLKIAWRNTLRERMYALINIIGLAIGIASCLIIVLYVNDELSYDRFHTKADRIYRANEFIEGPDASERSASMPFPFGTAIVNDFPHLIESSVRLFNYQAPTLALAYEEGEKAFNEPNLFFVDSTFFKVFDFPLVEGDTATALANPHSIVITESMATKYFEGEDPIGKVLKFRGQMDLIVTAIAKDVPANSHVHFDFLVSFSSLPQQYRGWTSRNWYWNPCWTYVLMREGASLNELADNFPKFVDKYFHPAIKEQTRLEFQPLTDIHLKSNLDYEIEPNGREANIYIFGGIALFILLIACINFMNLATARSANRAKEVGLRKTLGGHRKQLIVQFLTESTLMSVIAVIVAIGIVALILPAFNHLTAKTISLAILNQPITWLALLGIIVFVGFGAGIYPATVLTSFQPVKVLKGLRVEKQGVSFRKVLVVAQFTISIILMIGTGVAIQQLVFLQNDDLGFNKEHIVMVPVIGSSMAKHYENYKDEVLTHPDIISVTALEEVLGAKHQTANYQFEGMPESKLFPHLNIRHEFIKTFDIELLAGRAYDETIETDDSLALVINESMAQQLDWTPEEAIGKSFVFSRHKDNARIVGVVKDFNFTSKHLPISPLALNLNTRPQAFNLFIKYMAVRVNAQNIQSAISILENQWNHMVTEMPFEYFFLEDNLKEMYEAETKLTRVATAFSILAILIACLGLFGLATFMAEQRRKEIGIRKVLGSTSQQIVFLLSRDFTWLVLIASVFAIPLAYYGMKTWLQGFAYRIDLGIGMFVVSVAAAFLIAWLSVGYQAYRAAVNNPVEALRHE